MVVSYYTKDESSFNYKAIYNCAMLYLTTLMMTSPKVSEDSKNKEINS